MSEMIRIVTIEFLPVDCFPTETSVRKFFFLPERKPTSLCGRRVESCQGRIGGEGGAGRRERRGRGCFRETETLYQVYSD